MKPSQGDGVSKKLTSHTVLDACARTSYEAWRSYLNAFDTLGVGKMDLPSWESADDRLKHGQRLLVRRVFDNAIMESPFYGAVILATYKALRAYLPNEMLAYELDEEEAHEGAAAVHAVKEGA